MCSFLGLKKNLKFFIAIYIYIYIYISIYIYIYIYKKRTRVGHAFVSKERNVLRSFAKERCVLLHSFQNYVAFFAFFYVLCKRTLHSLRSFTFFAFVYVLCKRTLRSLRSFTFLRKERKRTHHSFGSHKSPKTRKRT